MIWGRVTTGIAHCGGRPCQVADLASFTGFGRSTHFYLFVRRANRPEVITSTPPLLSFSHEEFEYEIVSRGNYVSHDGAGRSG